MKHLLPIVLLFVGYFAQGQNINHVPNPSFEQYTSCPLPFASVSYCVGWRTYNGGSSDYFNSCYTGTIGVPSNSNGFQTAYQGNAYAGFFTYTANSVYNYKEYIAARIKPLVKGVHYDVSMYVSLSNNSMWGCDDLGVYFCDTSTPTIASLWIPVTPQVSFSSYGAVTDTVNWHKLSAVYLADSNYNDMIIGGFDDYSAINKVYVGPQWNSHSYYYVDSVEVKPIDTLFIQSELGNQCAGDTLQIRYYARAGVFNSGNVFIIQMSDANGSFTNPVTIGSVTATSTGAVQAVIPTATPPGTGYRIRIKSSSPVVVWTSPPRFGLATTVGF